MPRVALNAEQRIAYKLKDFKIWVCGKMKLTHKTQADVGRALGISQVRVSQMLDVREKKKGEKSDPDPFSYGQILILCELFGADEEERKKLLMM